MRNKLWKLGWTIKKLAAQTRRSEHYLHRVLVGRLPMTTRLARRIAKVTGTTAESWL